VNSYADLPSDGVFWRVAVKSPDAEDYILLGFVYNTKADALKDNEHWQCDKIIIRERLGKLQLVGLNP
jgi:hypothetical protein